LKRHFSTPRLVLYALLVLGFAAWYVPRISADRYREPLHAGLERALGRKVKIGTVRFQLVPTPGFTVSDVIIGEDPAIGPEPAAYVDTLRARPTFTALLGGPLEFASVDLEGAYINLTRVEKTASGVRWNFASLAGTKLPTSFPSVHLIKARVNFKFGDTKSVFYLLDTDIDLWPPAREDGPWSLRVHALPARTDRPARGFGSFAARGEWHPADNSLIVDVKLEKSELSDIGTLFEGHEAGLHGHIWGDAHLAGPMTRVGLAARLNVDDIHGWNQTPPGGDAWPFAIGGYINLPGQTIEIRTTTTGHQSPLDLRYRVTDYLARPRWAVNAIFSQLPMSPLVGLARNLGAPIPDDLKYEGTAQGAVGFSMPDGVPKWDGEIRVANSTLSLASTPPLRIADADLRFEGSAVTLPSTAVENEAHETASLSGRFDIATKEFGASLSTEGMSLASLRKQISLAGVPLLSQATAGTWSGNLNYSGAEASWTGDVHLKDADIPFEAFSAPLHILTADATLSGAGIVVKHFSLEAGDIQASGDYRYDPALDRPHRFRIAVAKCTGDSLQKLLMPALHRGNFLNYALNLGSVPQPDWLRAMHADGAVQIGSLKLGPTTVTKLRTRVLWDAMQVRLSNLQGQANDAAFSGLATVALASRQPVYQFSGKLTGLPWRSGAMDAEGTVTTSGTGSDLLTGLAAKGSFRARDVNLPPLDTWDRIDGCFEWSPAKLKLTQLVMTNGSDTYLGAAETQDDGQLAVRVSDGNKQIQASLKM
jgi:AsmA protein